MRTIDVPRLAGPFPFGDLGALYRSRFRQQASARCAMAIPLLGYMAWPDDLHARENGKKNLRAWVLGANVWPDFRGIHLHWGSIADVVNLHYALNEGQHQVKRGGTSLGKAIFLASSRTRSRGSRQSTLWRHWTTYKDVAHFIAAVGAVCFDIQQRHREEPFGIGLPELLPILVVSLFADLVIAVALTYQAYGLEKQPIFDPATLWRVPEDINIHPLPAPVRGVLAEEIAILNARRAGNRGRANRTKTTLIQV